MLTPEIIEKITAESTPDIVAALKKRLSDNAAQALEQAITYKLKGVVDAWVLEKLVPEIISHLEGNRAVLLQTALRCVDIAAQHMQEAIAKQMKESLESSYKREQVLKSFLGMR